MAKLSADLARFTTLEENLGKDVIQRLVVSQSNANDPRWAFQNSRGYCSKRKTIR